jgi:glycosyltransferase involved in cell wall biosynthesis
VNNGAEDMTMINEPLVSVITPVYNGEDFLAACVESVLGQTYENFEYIIVNNCSKDRSLEIALSYAKKDPRVRVHNNKTFVGVIANHNIAFGLISPAAKYCKVVSGDDIIYPDCLRRLVEAGESDPSVGIVGSYQQSGKRVKWQGFPYPRTVMTGREVCRQIFLGGDPSFGCGSPTSLLYRADLVRDSGGFYPNASAEADTSACFKHLRDCNYGFVYQVLSYERTHEATQSTKSAELNRYASSCLRDLKEYGPFYLSKEECELTVNEQLNYYYGFLAVSILGSKGKEFWDYHRSRLKELGCPLSTSKLIKAGVAKVCREMLNPAQALSKLRLRLARKRRND